MEPLDNTVVRQAVASFAVQPNQRTLFEVLRSCMFGSLLLDTTGSDVPTAAGFAAGSRLQIRRGTGPDGKGALFAFTGNEQIAKLYPSGTRTMSMVTPATGALELAKQQQDAWLYVDPAGPTCALSAADIDFALRNPNNEALKAALATFATGQSDRQAVVDVLKQHGPLLLAVDETTTPGKQSLRRTSLPDGSVGLFAFTSAPEVVAFNASDAVWALSTREVFDMVRNDGHGGLVVNPAGPYIAVSAAELAT